MADKIPKKNAPSSVGAGMKLRSVVFIPRKTGKTDVAQTKSAIRNRHTTSNIYKLKMTAGMLIEMRRIWSIQRAALSLTPTRTMTLLLTMEAVTIWEELTEDATSAATITRRMICQKLPKGAIRSKNAMSSHKRQMSLTKCDNNTNTKSELFKSISHSYFSLFL